MKLALLSDPHLTMDTPIGRKDDIPMVMLDKLSQVEAILIAKDIRHLLVAGDLTDVKRSWDLLAFLIAQFRHWKKMGIQVYSVLGQHDSYYHEMQNEKTVLGILIRSGLVKRLGKEPIILTDTKHSLRPHVYLYGASYGEEVPKVMYPEKMNILVIHKMVAMEKIWSKQKDLKYAPDFLKKYEKWYRLILCGDAHQMFMYERKKGYICNTGPLLRLEATKAMMRHVPEIMVYDTTMRELRHQVLLSSGAGVFTREHIDKIKLGKKEFNDFVEEILDQGITRYTFEYILRKYLATLSKEGMKPNSNVRKILSEVTADES